MPELQTPPDSKVVVTVAPIIALAFARPNPTHELDSGLRVIGKVLGENSAGHALSREERLARVLSGNPINVSVQEAVETNEMSRLERRPLAQIFQLARLLQNGVELRWRKPAPRSALLLLSRRRRDEVFERSGLAQLHARPP